MALLNVIRRWHFREHLSIREICRRTGLSRNTIRKYLRAGDVEPKFNVPERPSKLDPFADRLSAWLKTESKKGRKQKRTMKQLHADLVSLGYEGSYNRVAAFAREWRDDRQRELQTTGRGTFVPLAFEPGEAFQFDWSEDWAIIGNERTKLQIAHTKLSYSRAFIVRAYLLQTHEMLFDAHNHAFRVFGGIPGRGIYDNMRTAIDTSSAAGKAFLDMLGVFAEFETNLRRERQMEGIAAAKSRGVYKGRKPHVDVAAIRRLKSDGMGPTEIAKTLNIGRASVYRALREAVSS